MHNDDGRHTWLVIFLPALLYYILLSNRSSSSSSSPSSSSSILSHLGLFPNHFTSVSTHLEVASSSPSISRLLDSIFLPPSSSFSATSSSSFPLIKFEYIIQNKKDDTKVSKNILVDTVWVEDLELGRGYLLISDLYGHGTMWRYEIGGGPIPIGKSLFMDYSGCRSDLWNKCSTERNGAIATITSGDNYEIRRGSSGVTIQVTKDQETFLTGQLIVVEKGEQRIIRLEKDGSRTPIVLNVTTSLCNGSADSGIGDSSISHSPYRILNPSLVYYTPFGDLLFTDHNLNGCSIENSNDELLSSAVPVAGVYRLKEVVNVPPLSFQLSKDAHGWTEADLQKHWIEHGFVTDTSQSNTAMELLYSGEFEYISGIAIGKDLISLYIAGRVSKLVAGNENRNRNVKYVIIKVPIDADQENDDDEVNNESNDNNNSGDKQAIKHESEKINNSGNRKEGLLDEKATLFVDMTELFESSSLCQSKLVEIDAGISLAIDESGLIYATYPDGIAIIDDSDGSLIGTLTLKEDDNDIGSDESTSESNVCSSDFESNSIPNSITIGKDQYIYVTTGKGLMRMKVKAKPLEHPTNLIVPSKRIK